MALWSLLVYCPIAHWVWAPAAGSAQAGRARLRRRHGGAHQRRRRRPGRARWCSASAAATAPSNMAPHNLAYAVIGASLLWVGWFGFNAGSAVAANGRAGMAMAVTQIATAAAALGLDVRRVDRQGQAVGARHAISGAVAAWSRSRRPRASSARRRRSSSASPPAWSASGRPTSAEAHARLRRLPRRLRRARRRRHRRRAADRRVRLRAAVGDRRFARRHLGRPGAV